MLPQSVVKKWQGVREKVRGASDYDFACKVTSRVGKIQWNGIEPIVLGDEPLATCLWYHGDRHVVARCVYAPDEASALRALKNTSFSSTSPVETLRVRFDEPAQVIFDAGAPGAQGVDQLKVTVKPGPYEIITIEHDPSAEIRLMLHVFEPLSN
jgi:Immunity protein 21